MDNILNLDIFFIFLNFVYAYMFTYICMFVDYNGLEVECSFDLDAYSLVDELLDDRLFSLRSFSTLLY